MRPSIYRRKLMALFSMIIANNYIVAPCVGLIAGPQYRIMLEIQKDRWEKLKHRLSGFIVGRSAEKIADGSGIKWIVTKVVGGS